ncbi:DUF692 family protein [Nannocystis pusilla]|uniref:DUF692 family protein n=1 Tax=Nannocystis pusilla TaxID=889268 RepID=A0A9X3ENL1_9BACT|nr:DUF692 family multinuclear iron-containing protein [Nannocystis pusilla]MCY1006504.1 DUF692 family protein [Nannocystis pusilla]
MPDFLARVRALPRLGLGVSTEYGARRQDGALDPLELRRRRPDCAGFLEVGVEVVKGLDDDARAWAAAGLPTTYHFLDINLDDPDDFDPPWLAAVRTLAAELRPAWLCGDAGLWHLGRRDRGHMLLLPPILVEEAVAPLADGLVALREATGLEVLPENPPGAAFVGELHLLDFFARVACRADTGLLLDCAHLAMFQRARGHAPRTGFDGFPWDRVVELHVAGGRVHDTAGLAGSRTTTAPRSCPTPGRSPPRRWRGPSTCGRSSSSASATRSTPCCRCSTASPRCGRPAIRRPREPPRPAARPGRAGLHAPRSGLRRGGARDRAAARAGRARARAAARRRPAGPRGRSVPPRAGRARPARGVPGHRRPARRAGGRRLLPSAAFRTCAFEHGSMALSFGTWLGGQAGGPGRIEAAIARARRPRPGAGEGLACNPCVAPLLVPVGSLACPSASAPASAPTRPPRWRRPARRASVRRAGPIASRCWSRPARAVRCPSGQPASRWSACCCSPLTAACTPRWLPRRCGSAPSHTRPTSC